MDVDCTLDWIIDLGRGFLHPHRTLSLR